MRKKSAVLVILLLVVLLASACASSRIPPASEIAVHLRNGEDRFHAVVEAYSKGIDRFSGKDSSGLRVVIEEWVDGPDRMKLVYKEGPNYLKGRVAVVSGDEAWWYHPRENLYLKIRVSDMSFGPFSPRLTRGVVEYALEECDFKRPTEATMAGRQVFKLEAIPKESALESDFSDAPSEITFWIDRVTWNVLGWKWSAATGEMRLFTKSIEYNPRFPAGTFEFRPPVGARKVHAPNLLPVSLGEADVTVGFHVLRPSRLPEKAKLLMIGAIPSVEEDGGSIIMEYGREGLENFIVTETKVPKDVDVKSLLPSGAEAESVKVRGKEAVLTGSTNGSLTLQWIEDDVMISISGPLKRDAMLRIAESMK